MKFAILSLVAAAGLALTADTASAQYRSYGGYNRGYSNFYRGGYYGGYSPGWSGVTVARPGFGITIGSGNVYPYYGGYGYSRPYYYGGYNSYYRPNYNYGYRGYRGWRW